MPIRVVIETMGGYVTWDGDEKIAGLYINGYEIIMKIGENEYFVNSEKKELDVAPLIIDGRTMLPIRFVAESIGGLVEWVGSSQEIIIVFESNKIPEGDNYNYGGIEQNDFIEDDNFNAVEE